MKKGGIALLLISVLLFSIISVNFVSAGLLEDVWDKITGKVIENETETEACAVSISISFTQDVYYEGDYAQFRIEVFDSQGNKIPNYPFYVSIYEYSTDHWDETSSPEMTNNEGYFEFGRVVGEMDSKGKFLYKVQTEETSSCNGVEDTTEMEFRATETEESSLAEPEICAARITINFDKSIYYIGDTAKIEIKILDAQGNGLSNYVFYNQMYDGIWHTPGLQRTDNEGYYRATPTVEKKQTTVGEIKFKVYTELYPDCNSVEDIVAIEIGEKESAQESVACGIGTCIPEEDVDEVEAIPEERVFYKCNGCEREGKCYPMGYRKEGRYCSDNYEFVNQIKGECDNSFECESNVCISGECIEEGLIKKIIKWFKKLFGDQDKGEEPGLEMCSKLLIEKNIGEYEYFISEYGKREEHQVGLFSEDGEQIGIVKCCVAGYKNPDGTEGKAGIVCPFDNRKDVENALTGLLNNGDIVLGEYKGQEIYRRFDKPEEIPEIIVWTNTEYLIASGVGPGEGPLSEEVANAYLKKYPNDLVL